MGLFIVRHEHDGDHCPATDPFMGAMLLNHLSRPNVSSHGLKIHGEAVVKGEHARFMIVEPDADSWSLTVRGLVERPLDLSLHDLHNMPAQTAVVTLECAGNGRYTLDPPTPGEQWRLGAVSTAEWTGAPLTEVLDRAGISPQ